MGLTRRQVLADLTVLLLVILVFAGALVRAPNMRGAAEEAPPPQGVWTDGGTPCPSLAVSPPVSVPDESSVSPRIEAASIAGPVQRGLPRGDDNTSQLIAKWQVSGATDEGYNGTYTESGRHAGRWAYRHDDDHWLWWLDSQGRGWWVLSPHPGDVDEDAIAYCTASSNLPGNIWTARTERDHAPKVEPLALHPESMDTGYISDASADASQAGE